MRRRIAFYLRVSTAGQTVENQRRELKVVAASHGWQVVAVIGHVKSEHRMGRNYLWHRQGDAINAVLAAAGYNVRLLIRWLRLFLFRFLIAVFGQIQIAIA